MNVTGSPKRKEWLNSIIRNYGLSLNGSELTTTANAQTFPQKKHDMICAILAISEMEVLAKNTVSEMFNEDVRNMLDERNLLYTPQFIVKGKTGIDFTFDFQLAGRREEIVLKSFNVLNKMNVPNFLFSYEDVKEERERVSGKALKSVAIINDVNRETKPELLNAFETKGIPYILWSERGRQDNMDKLHAA